MKSGHCVLKTGLNIKDGSEALVDEIDAVEEWRVGDCVYGGEKKWGDLQKQGKKHGTCRTYRNGLEASLAEQIMRHVVIIFSSNT